MSKSVLILSGSPRKFGNSDTLCDEFMKGAIASGNTVEKIRVAEKKINYCTGCYHCAKNSGQCIFKDDMSEIIEKLIASDVIVLASPVYFYSISAQLKTLIDRTVSRWEEIQNKEFYFIATAAENETEALETTFACFKGFVDCCEGSVEKGRIEAKGVYEMGDVKNTNYLEIAFNMGKSIK